MDYTKICEMLRNREMTSSLCIETVDAIEALQEESEGKDRCILRLREMHRKMILENERLHKCLSGRFRFTENENLRAENEQLKKKLDEAIEHICGECKERFLREEGTMLCDECQWHEEIEKLQYLAEESTHKYDLVPDENYTVLEGLDEWAVIENERKEY